MKLILVSGPWSSGTSAVAGVYERLGYTGFGPYLQLLDSRAPNSYELIPFRDRVIKLVSESPLKIIAPSEQAIHETIEEFKQAILGQAFGPYTEGISPPVFLKLPVSALLVPWLSDHFDVRLVLVARPLEAIEKTRQRRQWPELYGAKGATAIYASLFSALLAKSLPTCVVQYLHLLDDPETVIRTMAEFGGYVPDGKAIADAVSLITESGAARARQQAAG